MFNRTRWSAFGAAVAVTLAAGIAMPSADATNTDGGGAGTVFVPITPCRLFDTRPAPANVGSRATPLGAGETFTQTVTGTNGNCTIPAQATAVALNVTTVDATATSFLTVWPADAAQPLTSNLNWVANSPATPNKVDVKLSATGQLDFFNNGGKVDVIADVVGYYADHDHDDRYYTKSQVDALLAQPDTIQESIPASALQVDSGSELQYLHQCSTSHTPESTGRVPLTLPIGARLVSVKVSIFDGGGAAINLPFTVNLNRYDLTIVGNGAPFDVGHFAGGMLNANTATATMTAPSGEVVTDGRTYDLVFTGLTEFVADGNAFCGAVVTYVTGAGA